MRQLHPVPIDEIDPLAKHEALDRPTPPDRPYVLVNMVASLDGATTAGPAAGSAGDGRAVSGGLGTAADRAVFSALRAVPDVILVAAGTANAERYRARGRPRPCRSSGGAEARPPSPAWSW